MNILLRLSLPLLISTALSLVFIHFVILPEQVEKARQETERKTLEILKASQASLIRNLLENDVASMYATMEHLERAYKNRWIDLQLSDSEGRTVFPIFKDQQPPTSEEFIAIEFPLEMATSNIGKISLQLDWSDEKAGSIDNFLQLEMMLLALFAVIVLISIISHYKTIVMPLEKLRLAASAISKGDYDTDLSHIRLNEINKLNDAFISMREHIQRSHHEIQSARKIAEDSLTLKNEFLANISHEIRTPLNAIIGMTHLALETPLDKTQENYLNKAHSSAESLRRVVNDLLDYSKLEANRIDLAKENFMLEDILENLASLFGVASESRNMDILFHVGPNVPTALTGDQLRLSQVLLNLCNNAIKFTPAGGIIRVDVKLITADDFQVQLQFSVCDNGIGMSEAEQKKLFKPFVQGDTSSTRHYGGTGLGLAISRRLTEIMDGEIWVRSEPGKGSTFYFSVTLGKQHDQPRYHEVASHLGPLNILVVDPKPAWHDFFRNLLMSLGFKPVFADNPETGLQQLKQASLEKRAIDLLLIDSHFDDSLFTDFLQAARTDKQITKIPASILLTGHKTNELRKKLESSRLIDGVLSKPITLNTLLDTIIFSLAGQNTVERFTSRQSASQQAISKLNNTRVLLVEDNEVNQELVLELLKNNGLDVVVASNGQEALDMLEMEEFDGILMDCQMPVMDGYTATRLIREKKAFENLPILAMTANVQLSDKQKAIAAGMNDHIDKPIHVEQMFKTMAKWIKPGSKPRQKIYNQTSKASAAPAPEPETPAPLLDPSVLIGIDLERGLRTVMNNEKLFLKLLKKFADSQQDFTERFNQSRQKDLTDAKREAHTLKGTAGNLGMRDLQLAAAELEKNCSENTADIDRSLTVVEEKLGIVLKSLCHLNNEENTQVTESRNARDDLSKRLSELRALVASDNINADKAIAKIRPLLGDGKLAPVLNKIEKAVEIYDFETALADTEQLIIQAGEISD